MSACDVRYCADGSIFSIKVRLCARLRALSMVIPRLTHFPLRLDGSQEVDIGLAADIGSLQRLPKVTGNASLVAEYALTARNFGPPEAERMGLVSATVGGGKDGVREKALEVARVIASASRWLLLSSLAH